MSNLNCNTMKIKEKTVSLDPENKRLNEFHLKEVHAQVWLQAEIWTDVEEALNYG